MSDHIQKFFDELCRLDLGPLRAADIIADGKSRLIKTTTGKDLYAQLTVDGDRAYGRWYSCARGEGDSWQSGVGRKWTDEEKREWKARLDAQKAADEAERLAGYEKAAVEATALWEAATACAGHEYLTRKKVKPYGVRVGVDAYGRTDCLLIPMRDREGRLWGLQSIDGHGEKMFMTGARKRGLYHMLGSGKGQLMQAEGYATGATLHQAMGLSVAVAFDAGNMLPVAEALGVPVIACGDNDQWTLRTPRPAKLMGINRREVPGDDPRWSEWREAGYLVNPGSVAAQAVAHRTAGVVALPEFAPDDAEKLTDWNDWRVRHGIAAVADALLPVVNNIRDRLAGASGNEIAAVDSTPPAPGCPVSSIVQGGGEGGGVACGDDTPPDFYDGGMVHDDGLVPDDGNESRLPFYVLGYDGGNYYYYPFGKKQIVMLTSGGHTLNNLFQLANYSEWKAWRDGIEIEGGVRIKIADKEIPTYAANWLMASAHKNGVFKPEKHVRGRGVWLDRDRIVYHAGHVLYVDGVRTELRALDSYYVYVQNDTMTEPSGNILSQEDAHKLRAICEAFSWENKLSGLLLAGWLTIAPVCAMLDWRPHIWITGQSGSGKTTIKNLISDILGDMVFRFEGGTTEPHMRTEMGYDALPVIYDEAEAENAGQKTQMENVLNLCRKASSGNSEPVGKFGQPKFKARFMAAFFAINPSIKAFADMRRMTMMVIKKNTSATAQDDYYRLCSMIAETITPEWRMGFIARTVKYMPQITENIAVFKRAARRCLNDAAVADQISPMLAGLYFLSRPDVVTEEAAIEWIKQHKWDEHTTIAETSDTEKLLDRITTCTVTHEPASGQKREVTIGELIFAAAGHDTDGIISQDIADKKLRQYGIRVKAPHVDFANVNQNLGRLLKNTVWSTGDAGWARTLSDFPGAVKSASPAAFTKGSSKQRYVSIPLSVFIEGNEPKYQQRLDEDFEEEIVWG